MSVIVSTVCELENVNMEMWSLACLNAGPQLDNSFPMTHFVLEIYLSYVN